MTMKVVGGRHTGPASKTAADTESRAEPGTGTTEAGPAGTGTAHTGTTDADTGDAAAAGTDTTRAGNARADNARADNADDDTGTAAGERRADAGAEVAGRPRWRDPVALAAVALVLLPALAAAASALRNPWAPTDDWALLELLVRDVGTGDTPLVGAWSRFGWDHPGPLPFYLLAIPYRLVPAEHGMLFAASVVNLMAVAAFAAVALRRPRAQALMALAGLALLQRGLGVAHLGDPWNPILPILPFALYALLCIDYATAPRRWTLPAAAGVASFVVQAHVGFAQPVALVGLVALALRRRSARAATHSADARPGTRTPEAAVRGEAALTERAAVRGEAAVTAEARPAEAPATEASPTAAARANRSLVRAVLPTAAVLALCWLPVAIDQVAGSGNLGRIVRWATGAHVGPGMGELTEGRLSLGEVAGAAAWLTEPAGLWLGDFAPTWSFGLPLLGDSSPAVLLWIPLALVVAVLVTGPTPSGPDGRPAVRGAAAVATAGVVATVTDLLSAEGAPVVWPFRWVGVVVMTVWVTVGWSVAAAWPSRAPSHLWGRRQRRSQAPDDRPQASGRATGHETVAGTETSAGRETEGSGHEAGPETPAGREAGGRGDRWDRAWAHLPAAGAFAVVAAAAVSAVWGGSLGGRPAQEHSAPLLRLAPAIEEYARQEPVVVANSEVLMDRVDLGLPVILERAGIEWVERDDERAAGQRQFHVVVASEMVELTRLTIDMGTTEVLARSGPPRDGEEPDSELLLLRSDPDALDERLAELEARGDGDGDGNAENPEGTGVSR